MHFLGSGRSASQHFVKCAKLHTEGAAYSFNWGQSLRKGLCAESSGIRASDGNAFARTTGGKNKTKPPKHTKRCPPRLVFLPVQPWGLQFGPE